VPVALVEGDPTRAPAVKRRQRAVDLSPPLSPLPSGHQWIDSLWVSAH